MNKFFHLLMFLIALPAHALINARPLKGYPDFVKLEFENRESVCSGFFLHPHKLVTAAHCLYSWKDKRPLKLEKIISENDRILDLTIIKILPHPLYLKGMSKHDIAIIETSPFKGFVGNFKLTRESPNFQIPGTLLGAGKINIETKSEGRTIGQNTFYHLSGYYLALGSSKNDGETHEASIAPNDSGSPLLNEQNEVMGLATKSTVSWTSGTIVPAISIGIDLREEENRKFLEE